MKRHLLVLSLTLLACLPLAAQLSPFDGSRSGAPRMTIPAEIQTPDGIAIPAGDYYVTVWEPLVKPVGRPNGSLGYWPGPRVHLRPAEDHPGVLRPARRWFTLATAVNVEVVYNVPGWENQRARVRSQAPEVAPMVRKGKLVAIVERGNILYITSAHPGISTR